MHSFGTLLRFIWRSSKRAVVFVVGVVLVVVGLIMFVTPGPGIVLLVAGLAVLATEFAWAEHLLDKAKEQAARAGKSAKKLPGVDRATSFVGRAVVRVVPRRWRRGSDGNEGDGAESDVLEVVAVAGAVEAPEVETGSETATGAPDTIDLTAAESDAEATASDAEAASAVPGRLPTGHRSRRASTGRHRADGDASVEATDTSADADRR